MNNLSLCFRVGADIERLRLYQKGKERTLENRRKPKLWKSKHFPKNSLLPSQQQPGCLLQTLTVQGMSQPFFRISKTIILAWKPREGTLHWSLVRLSWPYLWLPKNWPVRERTLETLRKAIWISNHYEQSMQTVLFFPILTIINKSLRGNEDTEQARLHNYDKESMVKTLSPCPLHELRPCLGLALLLSGMGRLIPSDSLKSQADITESTARTDAELHADARTKSHLALRKHQHFKSSAWLWWLSSEKNDASISWAMKVPGCSLKQA